MVDYVNNTVEIFPEELDKKVNTPADEHLYYVREKAKKLGTERAKIFHTLVARNIFSSKRSRPETLPTVAFLYTRVKSPDFDNRKKLSRLMTYLKNTEDDVLTLMETDLRVINWWVDGSYAVHPDFKGQTGGKMSMGVGAIYSTSQKQKINTRSSTETEIVAVYDCIPQILWVRYFLNAKGYRTLHTLNQDNVRSIKMAVNVKASSKKRTKHMNVLFSS